MRTWFSEVESKVNKGPVFPPNFCHENTTTEDILKKHYKKIYCRLFRVYVHIYYKHFEEVHALGAEAHLNSLFQSFIVFAIDKQLIDRDETEPLQPLIVALQLKRQQKEKEESE